MSDGDDIRAAAGGASSPPAYPMIEMRKRLMVAQGEIARLKDETRIGWLERALEREQQLRRDAEHALASLRAYCDTQPYPDDVERLRGRADYAEKTICRLVSTTDLRKAPGYLKRAAGEIVRKHNDEPLDGR